MARFKNKPNFVGFVIVRDHLASPRNTKPSGVYNPFLCIVFDRSIAIHSPRRTLLNIRDHSENHHYFRNVRLARNDHVSYALSHPPWNKDIFLARKMTGFLYKNSETTLSSYSHRMIHKVHLRKSMNSFVYYSRRKSRFQQIYRALGERGDWFRVSFIIRSALTQPRNGSTMTISFRGYNPYF